MALNKTFHIQMKLVTEKAVQDSKDGWDGWPAMLGVTI